MVRSGTPFFFTTKVKGTLDMARAGPTILEALRAGAKWVQRAQPPATNRSGVQASAATKQTIVTYFGEQQASRSAGGRNEHKCLHGRPLPAARRQKG
ncbi:hypothetical protein R6Q59_022440 [Mikania micrantha]